MFYYSLLGRNAASNVVHCPFNKAHSMPQKTLIIHLTKCPDRKPNQSICSFNNLHVVDALNLAVSNLKKKESNYSFKLIMLYKC